MHLVSGTEANLHADKPTPVTDTGARDGIVVVSKTVVIGDVPQFGWVDDTFYDSFADLSIVWQKQLRRGQPWPLQW